MKRISLASGGFLLPVLATVFVGYCLKFPIWVYGLFDRTADPGFFTYGVGAPFRDFPVLSFILVLAVLALSLCVVYSERLSSFFARNFGKMAAIALSVVIISCAGVYCFAGTLYKDAGSLREQAKTQRRMNQAMREFGASMRRGRAPDVAYYQYLDKGRVDSLYSQIEPEWLDKKSVVTASSSANAKVAVESGPVSGEVGQTGMQQTQTTREAAGSTTEKKCHVFMQYASEKKGATFYTNGTEWLIANISAVTTEHLMKPEPESKFGVSLPLNRAEMEELRLSTKFNMDNSQEATEAVNNDLRQRDFSKQLEGDLTNLPEFVFVSGDFRISTSGSLLLIHDFVGPDGSIGILGARFRPVQMDVTFPEGTSVPELKGASKKVTVFGKVIHGLDQQGTIEIRALAVY